MRLYEDIDTRIEMRDKSKAKRLRRMLQVRTKKVSKKLQMLNIPRADLVYT